MISRWLCSRRAGALSLLVVIGLSTTIHSSQAQSETCSLPSQHAGVTFSIEKVDPDWACRLQEIVGNYTITTTSRSDPSRFVRIVVSRLAGSSASGSSLDQSPGPWFV